MSNFASPASATGIEWGTLNGSLLIVDVVDVVKDINTVHGVTDAVRATVQVVDGPKAGDSYPDTLVFPRALKAQLTPQVGKQVLGRLGQGEAKPGQNPPWKLTEANNDDVTAATNFLTRRAAVQISADDV